jgi:hypothetical protein
MGSAGVFFASLLLVAAFSGLVYVVRADQLGPPVISWVTP